MVWELVAIWAIVAATLVWFVRDERRIAESRLLEAAQRFATGAAWRHRSVEPEMPPRPAAPPNPLALSQLQEKLHKELRRA